MSWTNIFDGEEGLAIRNKINNAMNALFDAIGGDSMWQDIAGENNVEPKDGKGVKTETLSAGETNQVEVVGNKLKCNYLGGFEGDTKPLVVNTDGTVQIMEEETSGDAPQGRGVVHLWTEPYPAGMTFDPLRPTILVEQPANFDIQMPGVLLQNNVEGIVRKVGDNAYAVTINTLDNELFWDQAIGKGLTTTEKGAYVKLKAVRVDQDVQHWMVIEMSGTWTLIT